MHKKNYKYEKYTKNINHIEDTKLYSAVRMALYLIVDIKRPLKYALSSSSKKHNVKPVKNIENWVRHALPDDFFAKRKVENAPKEKREAASIRNQMLREMEIQGENHLKDILKERR